MIRRLALVVLITSALLCTANIRVSGQIRVVLQDTTVARGALARVDVRLTSVATASLPRRIDSLRLVLRYTPGVLLKQSIQSALPTTLFNCPFPRVDSQFVNLSLGFLRISCSSLKTFPTTLQDTATLFSIEFRTLAAQEMVALVGVDSLFINGRSEAISVRPARITVSGDPVYAKFADALGQNYPNPVTAEGTKFPYLIAEAGEVRFAVFSIIGEMVYEFPPERRQQGSFTLEFIPPRMLASAWYNLRMTTGSGVQTIPFQIVR